MTTHCLIHLLDESIDLLLSIPQITPLNKVLELSCPEAPGRIRQFEWPKKVARLLEVWPHGDDLMYQILHTDDAEFAQVFLDDLVVGQGNALLVDFAIAALVDQVTNCLDGGIAISDVGFDDFEHFRSGFCDFDEDAVVDLEKTE